MNFRHFGGRGPGGGEVIHSLSHLAGEVKCRYYLKMVPLSIKHVLGRESFV